MAKRKRKVEAVEAPAWSDRELEVMQRHAHLDGRVVAGSMRLDGRKWTFEFLCKRCEAVRRIATQDAFQVYLCTPCTAEARKEGRRKLAQQIKDAKAPK